MNGSGRTTRRIASTVLSFLMLSALSVMAVPETATAAPKATASPAAAGPDLSRAKGTNDLWHKVTRKSGGVMPAAVASAAPVAIRASHVALYTLDNARMAKLLKTAPIEFSDAARTNPLVISLPAPDGTFQRFSVVYSPVMMPGLQRKHPDIRTYEGKGIDDPTATIRFSMTPLGFDAMTRGTGTWMVDPYYHLQKSLYGSYYDHTVLDGDASGTSASDIDRSLTSAMASTGSVTANAGVSVGSALKIYRLAMITDPAYAQDWGFDENVPSTAANVTAGKVTLVNRIDLAYETDLGYRMDLVANNDLLNFNTYAQAIGRNGPCGNAACYSLSNLTSCSTGTHQTVIGKIIGAANYDIGHLVLGASGGGVAGLGVVGGGSKASGCTGLTEVGGDYLAFDYTGHEMGHEFAMDHTFNGADSLNCNGNRTNSSAVEPGSGSTIMAYAGICTNDDIQAHNDPYFSFRSFDQSEAYTSSNLNPLNEVQTGSFYHFGGGNEVQQVTFGGNPGDLRVDKPGVAYATVKEIHPGIRGINGSATVLTGASEIGHTVTIQTTAKHEYAIGETVTIDVLSDNRYDCTSCAITALPVHGDTGSRTIQYTLPGFADLPNAGGGTITPDLFGVTESGNTVTVTTKTPHFLNVGDLVTIAGITVSGYNCAAATPCAVTAVLNPTQFQYTAATSGLAPSGASLTGTATVTLNSPFQIGIGGNDSPVIGGSGQIYNAANVQTAINNLLGGTCTTTPCAIVSGLTATGFTVTYSGGPYAGVDVPNFTLDNMQCHGCYYQVAETNHGGTNDSFTLSYGGGADSAVITNGSNFTTAGIQNALQGVSEVQTVTLSGYTANGNSYTLTYNGNDSVPITRGQNNTAAGIQAAIQGGNEQQAITFANFNAGNAGNSYQVQIGGNLSAVLGNGGTAISNNAVAAAINAISGFAGTVTVSGANNTTGPTITFGGASANTDVPPVSIVFGACAGAGTPCTATNRENVKGTTGMAGWIPNTTVSIGTATDTGYTVTFPGLGNVNSLSVTNGTGGASGTVAETTTGSAGILPAGASATVAGVANTGFTVTFGGSLGGANGGNISPLTFTNCTCGNTSFFGVTTKGGPALFNKGFQQISTGNTPPAVSTTPSYTIPYRTPFTLTGSATDPDAGQTLTYMWEQTNTGTGTLLTNNTKTNGPLFRVFGTALDEHVYQENTPFTGYCVNGENCTTTDPSRTFPDMDQILINNTNANSGTCPPAGPVLLPEPIVDCYSEFLPTAGYAGPMNFRLTVRDGNMGAGGVGSSDTSVSLAPGTGPFLVTSQATPVAYDGESTQTVTWDVAGTSAAPINATNVGILLSTDGGHSFPTTLAANTANDGSESVSLPNVSTSQARIKIQAVGNVFFDVNDSDFTIRENQTITFNALADKTWGDADFNVTATATSGLPVDFTVGGTDQCTITGTLVHIVDVGSCTVTAHQGGDSTHNAAPAVARTFAINRADQTIAFTVADHTYGDPDFTISATATSGLTVSFAVQSGNCSISGGDTVHITGAGNCTIRASQPGDANYNPASDVMRTFNINQASQTITFPAIADHTWQDADFAIGATSDSGLTVTFSATGDCTVTGTSVHITAAGSCTVTAHQPGDANYNPASDVMRTFTIHKADQTIAFTVADHTFGDADFTISATATSGLLVAFAVQSGNCSLSGGDTVHIIGAGDCTIRASQNGDGNFNAAPNVDRTFNINQASQTITFGALANKTYLDPNFSVSATATSGLAVTFTASGDCTVSGTTVHITGAGSCTVTAHQAGNGDYNPASDVPRTFSIAKHGQSITFPAIAKKAFGAADFNPGASASSGLAITYGASGVCTIVAGKVHLTGNGQCNVTAFQNGNANYLPAIDVTRHFNVTPIATHTTLSGTTSVVKNGTITLNATVTSTAGGPTSGVVRFMTNKGTLLATVTIVAGHASTNLTAPGSATTVKFKAKYVPATHNGWKTSTSTVFTVHVHN